MKKPLLTTNFPTLPIDREHHLREISTNDLSDLHALYGDAATIKYIHHNHVWSVEKVERRILQMRDDFKEGTSIYWGIAEKSTSSIKGIVLLHSIDPLHHSATVGYMINRLFWGKGLAFKALQTVLTFGFKELKLNRIDAQVYAEHLPSIRILEKAGMQREGRLRKNFFIDGKAEDALLYSILYDDFTVKR
jgi:ribosomal-protein-alanine N-acetyltransferase